MSEPITQANLDQTKPPKKNVIIYARYSSELQRDTSIDDQIRVCQQALHEDEKVIDICVDQAMSGSHLASRPGMVKLLAALEKEQCSVIIAEGLDRLSRDMCDTAHIYRLASFHGVAIRTLIDGPVNKITLGFKGAMNGVQLDDLKHRTRRGQVGKILAGKAAGGLPYGYDVQYLNDDGLPERGLRKINPEQAAVVQSIYADYATEMPVLQIVKRLNAAGIPSPRGGKWSAVTITGHYDRGDGILQNALYRGLLVWGRCPEVKHPVTNKRQIRTSTPEERASKEVPELRIVEDDLWFTVEEIRRGKHQAHLKRQSFSTFTLPCFCARCGEIMIRNENSYVICNTFKRHQACANSKRYAVTEVVDLLCSHLHELSRAQWQNWVKTHANAYMKAADTLDEINQQLDQEDARLERLVEAIADGLATSRKMKERVNQTEQNIEKLISARSALGQSPHPDKLCRSAFRSIATKAKTSEQHRQFVADMIKSITLDREANGKLTITHIKPDFTAIAAL